jgi:nucleoside-diphosphate-sugar epimerase
MIENALSDRPLVLYGEGSRRQNYVDVRDIASAIEKCISTRQGGIFNIGGMSSISNKELAETCIRCLGSQSVIEYAGKPDPEEGINWEVSIAKARKLIGYEPALSIEDSILGIAAVTSRQMHPR